MGASKTLPSMRGLMTMLVWRPLIQLAKRYLLSVGTQQSCDVLFQTDDQAILPDKKMFSRDKTGSVEEEDCSKRFPQGKFYRSTPHRLTASLSGRRASRKRTISKERRPSLLFEDQMATYFYVEMAECYTPPTKSKAKLPSQVSVSPDCASQEIPASSPWSLSTDKTAFIIRVPNESIIRLFSLLVSILSLSLSLILLPGERSLIRTVMRFIIGSVHNQNHRLLASVGETNPKPPSDMITLQGYIVTIWQIRDIEIETFSQYQISSKKY